MWHLDPTYRNVLVVGAGVQVGLAGWILLRGRGPVTMGRVLVTALAVAALSLAQLPVLVLMGANLFGLVMLAWIVLAMIVPLCGLAVLTRAWARATRPARITAAVGLLPLPLALWASLVEPYSVILEQPTLNLPAEREGARPLRIGILADLQTTRIGAHERDAVRRLMNEEPDVILLPGDLFQGHFRQWNPAREDLRQLLTILDAPGGVYVVSGNSDHKPGLPGLLEGTGCQLLVNRTVEIPIGDRRLRVLGLEDGFFPGRVLANFERDARGDPGAVHLVLVHRPGVGLDALSPDSPVDLVVGGHTHGGQVVVPGFGPPVTLSSLPRHAAAGGLHRLNGNAVYVSRGLGMERKWAPRIRLFCPPEITLLTLDGPTDL